MMKRGGMVAVSGLLLLVAGCEKKPTGQTVAVVNGEEISAGELNYELQNSRLADAGDPKVVKAQLLQGIIDRRLLAQDARADGVDKSPEFISRQRAMTDQLLIAMNNDRQANSQKLPDQAAIDAFIAQNPSLFGQREILALQQIVIDPPSDPKALAPLRDAHTMDEVAAMLTKLNIPFTRTNGRLDTATVPPETLKRILALPATEPFVLPAAGKLYANIIVGRTPVTMSQEDMRKTALQAMRQQSTQKNLLSEVKQLRSKAKIEYQPGYAPPAAAAAKK
jgi:EpsD family peptidyl-prolyl cis-trans isomerase